MGWSVVVVTCPKKIVHARQLATCSIDSPKYRAKNIFRDESGFTTLSVVVTLLITLALIFSTAQVYRLHSESAKIQNVADACAQSAEAQVGEFMILVRVCDSVILSLGLGGIVAGAIGVVCMCIPGTQPASAKLIEFAQKMIDARDKFANTSAKALDKLQLALPYLCAARSFQVAAANNGGVMNSNYIALSVLQPGEGVSIQPGNINEVKNTLNDVEQNSNDLRAKAAEAERLAQQAESSKYAAWQADCGAYPNYCMADRAEHLAHIGGSSNPIYRSVDTWNFGVAILRSRAYFQGRLNTDQPTGSSTEAYADWVLRQHYYRFALRLMNRCYYYNYGDSVNMNFEHIPDGNNEMQGSELFTTISFPITRDGDKLCMHAYASCPGCTQVVGRGTAQSWNSSDYTTCPHCKFTQSHFGSVASATAHNPSGYEYHYRIVEEQSKLYQEAKNQGTPYNNAVKNTAGSWLQRLRNLISQIGNKRIYAKPPGAYGAISIVVNASSAPASTGFESSFVSSDATLGMRAAISASTLIEENSTEGKTLVNSILTGLTDSMPGVAGVGGVVLNAWSGLLKAYSDGSSSVINAIEGGLNSFSFNSSSGLGTWAAKFLRGILGDLGLEPANLNALKPVLINSWQVARAGSSSSENPSSTMGNVSKTFAVKFLTIREGALKVNDATNSVLSGLADANELQAMLNLQAAGDASGAIEVARISPLGDWGPQIPINITLPASCANALSSAVNNVSGAVQSILGLGSGGKIWR